MTTTMSELKRKAASRSDRERASQRVDFNLSPNQVSPGRQAISNAALSGRPKQ